VEIAREAAPEIDRLVLSVNRGVGPKHGGRLLELARECGLETLELLPHFGDFLRAGKLTRDLATLRMRYMPPGRILSRLDELEGKLLIRRSDSGLVATPALQPLLEALSAAEADVAAEMWADHHDDVTTVTPLARRLVEAASDDHVVAVVHRTLPEPADPYLLLLVRLVTLRYIRQHDHAMAWHSHGLTAPEMVTMTELWHDQFGDESGHGLTRLVAAGLAEADPPRLTSAGHEMREAIEGETNRRSQETFDVLDPGAGEALIAALRRLPGTTD